MYKPIVFMFSGQGSHYFQMGKELFEHQATFRGWMTEMDKIVARMLGCSIIELLYDTNNRKEHVFDRMRYTHPAIFMVEYALSHVLKERGITPDILLGSSLGEYSAAAVAGVIDVEEMLTILVDHAMLCEQYCADGGMIAIFGSPEVYHSTAVLHGNCEIASINFDSHFVVSGSASRLKIVAEYLDKNEINFQLLPVAHAYHSSIFDSVKSAFLETLKNIPSVSPAIPVISCAAAKVLDTIGPEDYWNAVRSPILFQDTLLGIEQKHNAIYLDLGPSGTLSTFAKYVLPKNTASENFPILTPFGRDVRNLDAVKQALSNRA